MKYFIVDAFAKRPFSGNTAGVVLDDGIAFHSNTQMQAIAAELRYSETAFVLKEGDGTWHLRYFTPRGEVDLCGHATVATFAVLHHLGIASGTCRCHTQAGELEVQIEHLASSLSPRIMLQTAAPAIVRTLTAEESAEAYHALGLQSNYPELPPAIVSTGLPDIMLHLPSAATLDSLQPNMEAITTLTERLGAVSLHPFAFDNDGYTAHVRDFAPGCGIPEESATGTANASLTYYLTSHGLAKPGDKCSFLQGEAMGRPSVVETVLAADGSVWVGGTAAIVAEGEFLI
ncbi:MAG: PhzF family phenazine biosynthesis protein [Bacteroidales bacterium]|nr:PhzF family phenazine biosynthesis protein [Bacteroidales bacterium]